MLNTEHVPLPWPPRPSVLRQEKGRMLQGASLGRFRTVGGSRKVKYQVSDVSLSGRIEGRTLACWELGLTPHQLCRWWGNVEWYKWIYIYIILDRYQRSNSKVKLTLDDFGQYLRVWECSSVVICDGLTEMGRSSATSQFLVLLFHIHPTCFAPCPLQYPYCGWSFLRASFRSGRHIKSVVK